jgi:hypothetical protein
LLIYDIYFYSAGLSEGTCEIQTSKEGLSNFVWFVSRSFSFYIWTIPIIGVFLPKCNLSNTTKKLYKMRFDKIEEG